MDAEWRMLALLHTPLQPQPYATLRPHAVKTAQAERVELLLAV